MSDSEDLWHDLSSSSLLKFVEETERQVEDTSLTATESHPTMNPQQFGNCIGNASPGKTLTGTI